MLDPISRKPQMISRPLKRFRNNILLLSDKHLNLKIKMKTSASALLPQSTNESKLILLETSEIPGSAQSIATPVKLRLIKTQYEREIMFLRARFGNVAPKVKLAIKDDFINWLNKMY